MKKKKNQTVDNEQVHNILLPPFDAMDIVSSTECTGMLYKPPLTDEEVAGYTDVYYVRQFKNQPSPPNQSKDKE